MCSSLFSIRTQTCTPILSAKVAGLVEIDDSGKISRSASNADPAFPDAWLTPYSLVPSFHPTRLWTSKVFFAELPIRFGRFLD
jgi:hypothetical protein